MIKNKKAILVISLQAGVIVLLFWLLIFYSKDEYDTYQTTHEESIKGANRVSEHEGMSMVSLSRAVQKNSGISTEKVVEAHFKGDIKSTGNVVAIDSLIEAKAQYLSLISASSVARAASNTNAAQYLRLKALNADDKNVSDRAVQEALALVNADKAAINSSVLQLKNLQTSMKLQWGEALATLLSNDQLPPHLTNLLNRNNVLVQVSLPISNAAPQAGSTIQITPLNETIVPIVATYVSAAAQTDSNGFGNTFYYSAPAEQLRIGMRINLAFAATANDANGVIIPNSAVVWYAGKPWAYFKVANNKNAQDKNTQDQFIRKPISAESEMESGWFNQGLSVGEEVVVNGAQLLLSEEFKSQIKNENED